MKMKYSIEFIYSNNNQVYLEDIELEPEEFDRLNTFLYGLEKAGVIEKEGGGGELIFPFSEPLFTDLEDLKQRWAHNLLIEAGAEVGLTL